MRYLCAILIVVFILDSIVRAQDGKESNPFAQPNLEALISPILAIESWGVYSLGPVNEGEEYANRGDLLFRRFRLGAQGNPYPWFKYSFQLNLDRFGEGVYTPIKGKYQGIGVWNAYVTIKMLRESELLNLHVGYFWSAVSREYNTSPWAVGSFDKVRADWFLRKFVSGEGNGITGGMALGGLKNFENWGVGYRVGVYEPSAYACADQASYLFTGRLMLTLGEPEQKTYSYMLSGNQWRKRKGVTIGFGGSSYDKACISDTLLTSKNISYGTDVLLNFVGLRFDAAYYVMIREANGLNPFNGSQWHVRLGYSLLLWNKYIEPVVSYDQYSGTGNEALFSYLGDDKTLDVGLNWYMNKDKMKLAMHYIMQAGGFSKTRDYMGVALQYRL